MGRKKQFRQEIIQHANSLKAKNLYVGLIKETNERFVPEKAMAEIVATKAYSTLKHTIETRYDEDLIITAIAGRNNHCKTSFQAHEKRKVHITPYLYDEIELFESGGLRNLQNNRICRIIEQVYFQDALLNTRMIAFLTNLNIKTVRERLKTLWKKGIRLPLCGMKKEHRSPDQRFRSTEAIRRYLQGDKVGTILDDLYLTRREFLEFQLEMARISKLSGSYTKQEIILQTRCDREKVQEYLELLENEKLSPQFRQVEKDLVYSKAPQGKEWQAFAEDLEVNHNWSPAKIKAYFEFLENYHQTDSPSRPDNTVIYYAISSSEPAGKPLAECQKVPVMLSYYTPEEQDQFDCCSTSRLKWGRILRYTTEARKEGALLNQSDLVFLLGAHSSVIQRLLKENKEVLVPTRGNFKDIGPGISHAEKIIELYVHGYTETQIKKRTSHSYESIENYIRTFATLVGLLERGLPLPLIRQVMGKSMTLVKRYKALYDKYNTEEYAFFFHHLLKIFEHEEFKKKSIAPRGCDSLAGKGVRYYDSLLGKGVENAQKQRLRKGFEFSQESWLADKIVTKFNNTMAIWEKENGVTRLKPGEILVLFQGKEVVIPLLKPEWLKRLANWGYWAEMRPELETEILEVLKTIDSNVSLNAVRYLFNQRGFLQSKGHGFLWENFKFPATLGKPQSYKASKITLPEDLMIPTSVMEEMVEYLTSAEKLSPEKATAIVETLALERESFCLPKIQVKPGQIVWIGMDAAEPISFHTKTSHRKQVPLLLTLYTPQEWQETSSITTLEKLYQHVLPRLERVCFEAYHSGAVLCETELHLMFFLSLYSISKLARKYMEHTEIILPLAGTIKDYGRAATHKRIIIKKHLEGWLNKEIARFTHHDEESVDKYIEVFKSVTILYIYGLPPKLMARILNKYTGVIEEHIDIIESFLGERGIIVNYLENQGITIP